MDGGVLIVGLHTGMEERPETEFYYHGTSQPTTRTEDPSNKPLPMMDV